MIISRPYFIDIIQHVAVCMACFISNWLLVQFIVDLQLSQLPVSDIDSTQNITHLEFGKHALPDASMYATANLAPARLKKLLETIKEEIAPLMNLLEAKRAFGNICKSMEIFGNWKRLPANMNRAMVLVWIP